MPQTDQQDDGSLATQCQDGDKQAFGILVKRYMKRAYYTALGFVGSREDALDISQDAFVHAYRSISKFQPGRGAFFTWYYKIERNLCFNFIRDRKKRAVAFSNVDERAEQLLEIPDEADNPEIIAERDDVKDALWKAISALREEEREVIILKDFQNMFYKEIADTLDCPIGTVMSRLFNARKRLRHVLERYL
jgi:RNA polymerase sigma-70 factor (ECF subfamily)